MVQAKDKKEKIDQPEKSDEKIDVVEPDIRFPEEKSKSKEKEEKEPKRKFGDKKHKKDIKKENRLKFYYKVVNRLRGFIPESVFGVLQGIGRILDYAFNLVTIASIIYCIYIGVVIALPSGDWIKVASAAVLIVVIAWLSEKIS